MRVLKKIVSSNLHCMQGTEAGCMKFTFIQKSLRVFWVCIWISFFFPHLKKNLPESHSHDLSLVLNFKFHFEAMQAAKMKLGHGKPRALLTSSIPLTPTRLLGSEIKYPELIKRERTRTFFFFF